MSESNRKSIAYFLLVSGIVSAMFQISAAVGRQADGLDAYFLVLPSALLLSFGIVFMRVKRFNLVAASFGVVGGALIASLMWIFGIILRFSIG